MLPIAEKDCKRIRCAVVSDWTISKSAFDSSFVEVRCGGDVVEEMSAPFFAYMYPRKKSFSSLEEAKLWLVEVEKKSARARALRLLSQRSYSSKKLFDKLREKKFSPAVFEETIEEMKRLGFLQDTEVAKRLMERESRRGMGPFRIAAKMKAEGLSMEKISDAEQRRQIRALWDKSSAAPEKKARTLIRRGFDARLVLERFEEN